MLFVICFEIFKYSDLKLSVFFVCLFCKKKNIVFINSVICVTTTISVMARQRSLQVYMVSFLKIDAKLVNIQQKLTCSTRDQFAYSLQFVHSPSKCSFLVKFTFLFYFIFFGAASISLHRCSLTIQEAAPPPQ